MASEERIPFLGEEEQEVTKVQIASENDDSHQNIDASELFSNSQTHSETEARENNELVIEQGVGEVNIKGADDKKEETCNVSSVVREPSSDVVDSTSDSVDCVKNSAQVDTNESQQVDVTGEKPIDNQDTTITGAVDVNVTVKAEEGVPSTSSEAQFADDKAKESALCYAHVLLVHGLPPREAGNLKQLLNMTLGGLGHRIRPRQKGDKVLYVHFQSEDEMKIAQSLLHNQDFLGYTLHAKVVSNERQKRKGMMIEEDYIPPAKKMRRDPESFMTKQEREATMIQSTDKAYAQQLKKKSEDLYSKLQRIGQLLRRHYPKYDRMICKREMKYGGLICVLEKFLGCPPEKRHAIKCKFSIGIEEESGRLVVGFHAGGPNVNKVSSVKHNYPPHVVQAAKVFEDAIQDWERVSDADGVVQYKFWHELVIHTNQTQDMMFMVYVQSPQETAEARMKRLDEELKVFFENEEAKKCRIISIYTKVTHIPVYKPQQLTLSVGSPYIEEVVLDLKFHLVPSMHFWNNIHAAKMVCRGIAELLQPTKKISVLEVGCGFGLIGLYLSKMAGEVLSVDEDHFVAEAKKHAELNGITGCQYFGGKPDELLPVIATKITCMKACAIVIGTSNHFSTCAKAMKELRKIPQVRRVVLVTEMFYSRFNPIMALSKPTSANNMGYPFFPLRAIPVDTKPTGKGYLLLILMERVGLFNLVKSPGHSHKSKKAKDFQGFDRRAPGMWRPYEVEAEYTELLLRGTEQM